MAQIHVISRDSPEPLGSIARASNVAIAEALKRRGYPLRTDYTSLAKPIRDEIHLETCKRVRQLLGQE